jgi:hypothetical protein
MNEASDTDTLDLFVESSDNSKSAVPVPISQEPANPLSSSRIQQNNGSTGEGTLKQQDQSTDSSSSSPTLARNAPLSPSSSSLLKHVEVKSKEGTASGCHISSYGEDGIGHQMDAKISCLITASALNWTYVHQPMRRADHGADAVAMENLFGVSQALPLLSNAVLYDSSTMQLTTRAPLPDHVGHCAEKSWFDNYRQTCDEDATHKDSRVAVPVYSSDNCWDYFYCRLDSFLAQRWETILPPLRDSFLRGLSGHKSAVKHNDKLLIAMHMRMGDAGDRSADKEWCKLVLRNLLNAASLNGERVQVNVHSDATHKVVNDLLDLDDTPMKDSVTIYAKDDENASLEGLLYDMVTADILVSSDSALSRVSAMLRTREQGSVIHPAGTIFPRVILLGWNLLRKTKTGDLWTLEACSEVSEVLESGKACAKWDAVEKSFWSNLVQKRMTK